MKIDFTEILKDMKGENLKEQEFFINSKFIDTEKTPNEKPEHSRLIDRTLSGVCLNALHAQLKGDESLSGTKKQEMFVLSTKIYNNDHAELDVDERKTIKDRVSKSFGTLITGRAWEMLDPPTVKEDKVEKTN